MRMLGSSIPADIRVSVPGIGRDVTAESFISAVSLLLSDDGPGNDILGPARCAVAPPPVPSGARDLRLGGRGARCKDSQRVQLPRSFRHSPPVGGKPAAECWGCGAAGYFLRRCPLFRRWCGGESRAPAAGGGRRRDESGNVTGPRNGRQWGYGNTPHLPAWRRPGAPKKGPGPRPHRDPDRRSGRSLRKTAPAEPTAGAKGASSGKPAGAPYRGPRNERDPAPRVDVAHRRCAAVRLAWGDSARA